MFWLFIRIVYTGEILDFPLVNQLVESLDIALAADFNRTFDIDLDKVADFLACPFACFTIGGNGGRYADHTVAGQQVTDEGDALDVGIAVLTTKTQPLAQMCPYHISIKNFYIATVLLKTLDKCL